jgi:hypothetical protein
MPFDDDLTDALISQCRKKAKAYRGVKYDKRLRKFVAQIYDPITKRQRWLGAHATAEQAHQAYQEAYQNAPEAVRLHREKAAQNFSWAYGKWFDECAKANASGYPEGGDVFVMPDGQRFFLWDTEWRWIRRKRWGLYVFTSTCRVCGEPYETRVPGNPKGAKGITRNCPDHRKEHPFRRIEATGKKLQEAAPMQHVADVADVAHEPEDGSDLI